MSMSVYVSVCPRGYLWNHTRDLYKMFYACCLWLWLAPPPSWWRNYKGKWQFWGFPENALYSIAFGIHTKIVEPIEMPFGMMSGLGPRNSVLHGGDDSQRGRGNFGWKHVPNKPNAPVKCKLDWSMLWRAHKKGRRLIARVGRVYYRPRRGWDCTPRVNSDIYDCIAVFCNYYWLIVWLVAWFCVLGHKNW